MLWDSGGRVESTTAVIFFGTPKEGEQCGRAVAEVA